MPAGISTLNDFSRTLPKRSERHEALEQILEGIRQIAATKTPGWDKAIEELVKAGSMIIGGAALAKIMGVDPRWGALITGAAYPLKEHFSLTHSGKTDKVILNSVAKSVEKIAENTKRTE